jgi:hypothetical protein
MTKRIETSLTGGVKLDYCCNLENRGFIIFERESYFDGEIES